MQYLIMLCDGLSIAIIITTYFDKNGAYQFQLRNISWNHLCKLYDMQRMKPTQKIILISITKNYAVSVTVFDNAM